MKIDIYIPVSDYHYDTVIGTFYSVLGQSYEDIRIVMFLDGVNEKKQKMINLWYKNFTLNKTSEKEWYGKKLIIEESKEGHVLVKNLSGQSNLQGTIRQWIFEWEKKSELVKMLDADDVLLPDSIKIMMRYYNEGIDGIFCPMVLSTSYRMKEVITGEPRRGKCGSGSMLLHRNFMNKVIKEFSWLDTRGDDGLFLDHIEKQNYNFITTKENFLYMYIKR